jgi:uncharacterized protein (UPF0276 family)
MMRTSHGRPFAGIGYRLSLHDLLEVHAAEFEIFEATVDHFFDFSERQRSQFREMIGAKPIVLHGVGLSLGTDIPLDMEYLDRVARMIDWLQPLYYSEHLAFTGVPGNELGILLPLPKTGAVVEAVADKVRGLKNALQLPICLENIAYYFLYPDEELTDSQFLNLVCQETNTKVLLDLQNLYVNSVNFGDDPYVYIDALPKNSVLGMHLAGGRMIEGVLVDTHGYPVTEAVLDLLRHALATQAPDAVLLERDNRLDATSEIIDDFRRIKNVLLAQSSTNVIVPTLSA